MKLPDFLYHYTSIETLALILSKRTLRFNCLSFVDDPDESKASDIEDIGRLCVVSCWTDREEESIPMWQMYTPNSKGVRLKMRRYPFKEYPATMKGSWIRLDNNEIGDEIGNLNNYRSYIDENKIARENRAFVIPPAPELIQMSYSNKEEMIYPQILFDKNNRFEISGIGQYKRECWEFQSEWRYRILFTPFSAEGIEKREGFESIKHSKNVPYKEYYLELSENALEGAEVVMGPKTSEAEKIIVESLIEKFQGEYIVPVRQSKLSLR